MPEDEHASETSHIGRMDQRERDRTERIEEELREELDGQQYPTNTAELSREYAQTVVHLPRDTESLGDVFDRLAPDEYDSPQEAREAVLGELTGTAGFERGDDSEYNPERELDALEETEREEGKSELDVE